MPARSYAATHAHTSIAGFVASLGVLLLRREAAGTLDVLVRRDRVAAVAALVTELPVARDNLLRGHDNRRVAGQDPLTLDGLRGGVRPARTAISLVLHLGHDALDRMGIGLH